MNTSILHLPEEKQEQLRLAVEIIREETEVEMIILFGSYAAGTWVEEAGPDPRSFEYQSDFDLYALVEDKQLSRKGTLWARIEQRLRREVSTPVQLLVDLVGAFDGYIRAGRYFYADIRTQGVLLYDSENFELAKPREVRSKERLELAREEYEYWFNSANSFLASTESAIERGDYPHAVFLLHQVAERLYSAVLLVYTNYRPKLHDIEKLAQLSGGQAPELVPVFPIGTAEERRLFDLLRGAYIESRYDKTYAITKEEMEWMAERVEELRRVTEEVCERRIKEYRVAG